MRHKYKFFLEHKLTIVAIIILLFILGVVLLVGPNNVALLNSQGLIARQERNIILLFVGLMLLVAIPVLFFAFYVAFKYRVDNDEIEKLEYAPDWDKNKALEVLKFAIPGTLIVVLAILTWKTSHSLDPFKPIASTNPPMTIQVVALEWKWLFIYPRENIATVNYVEFPSNTPVNFELTSDAPMNSFWIPSLGGQMYMMAGMTTRINLMADNVGEYQGSAAEINGRGFADMKFKARSVTGVDFNNWITEVKQGSHLLTQDTYDQLAKPTENNPVISYSAVDSELFNNIIAKFGHNH